jgi:hypothetical protein
MNVEAYRKGLLGIEATLSGRVTREENLGREQLPDTATDACDASVADAS